MKAMIKLYKKVEDQFQKKLKNGTIKPIKTKEDVADAWQQIIETEKATIQS